MSISDQVLLQELLRQEGETFSDIYSDSEFFEFFSSSQILRDYELSYEEISSGLMGSSLDGGVDSVYILINGDLIKEDMDFKDKYNKNPDIELVIIQSKKEKGFNEDVLLKFSRLSKNLLILDFDASDFLGRYNASVIASFSFFREVYLGLITKKPTLKISFYYSSLGLDVHKNVQMQADELCEEVNKLMPSANVSMKFLGASDLLKSSQQRPNEVFQLTAVESPLSTSKQVFISLINIGSYYNFISDNNGKLLRHIFESNVRDYQGMTNVNKEIQATLVGAGGDEFWWLNNGITVLATDATTPGGKELVVHNPQIVNGLQTSSEIHRFFTENPDRLVNEKRSVLVRFIVPEDEETRDRIIRATNSQTPIPKSSLRATDHMHRNIEVYLKSRGLFYDRRKNFYKNEGKKPKEIVSLQFLSQCLMSTLLQRPDSARARPSTLLENDESYGNLFHKNNALMTYFRIAKWGRSIELRLRERGIYEASEINDIKFYVLYYISALYTKNLYPKNSQLSLDGEVNLENVEIDSAADTCYDIYKQLGGNDRVAKGSEYLEKVKAVIKKTLSLPLSD